MNMKNMHNIFKELDEYRAAALKCIRSMIEEDVPYSDLINIYGFSEDLVNEARLDKEKEEKSESISDDNNETSDKKYRLLDLPLTHPTIRGKRYYRIKALKDFGNVKAGDIGGFVTSEANLSQEGNCWIYDDASVLENAQVYGDASIRGYACVSGNAKVCECADVKGKAKVYENAKVKGSAIIKDDARVHGNCEIDGKAVISGSAKIAGKVIVCSCAKVYGNSIINGSAIISGEKTRVHGKSFISGDSKIANVDIWDAYIPCYAKVLSCEDIYNMYIDFHVIKNKPFMLLMYKTDTSFYFSANEWSWSGGDLLSLANYIFGEVLSSEKTEFLKEIAEMCRDIDKE